MTLYFHPEARQELYFYVEEYEDKAEGLGAEFLDQVEQTLELIQTYPQLGSAITEADRRMLISSFPFALIYSIHMDTIVIYALMHLRRKPGYWKPRK